MAPATKKRGGKGGNGIQPTRGGLTASSSQKSSKRKATEPAMTNDPSQKKRRGAGDEGSEKPDDESSKKPIEEAEASNNDKMIITVADKFLKRKATEPTMTNDPSQKKRRGAGDGGSKKPAEEAEASNNDIMITTVADKVDIAIDQEIKHYQKSAHPLCQPGPFRKLVRDLVDDATSKAETPYRIAKSALEALQEATEAFAVGYMENINLCAAHGGRITIMSRDMVLARLIMSSCGDKTMIARTAEDIPVVPGVNSNLRNIQSLRTIPKTVPKPRKPSQTQTGKKKSDAVDLMERIMDDFNDQPGQQLGESSKSGGGGPVRRVSVKDKLKRPGQEVSDQKVSKGEASGQEASGLEASGLEASGRGLFDQEATGKEASGKEASGKEASGGEASGGEASGGEVSGKEPSGGEPSGGEASGGEASGGEASGGEVSGKEPSGGEASGGENEKD
ncbi:MAG: hypothetical protein Q9181_007194 [Wetmoreana brouardii]